MLQSEFPCLPLLAITLIQEVLHGMRHGFTSLGQNGTTSVVVSGQEATLGILYRLGLLLIVACLPLSYCAPTG